MSARPESSIFEEFINRPLPCGQLETSSRRGRRDAYIDLVFFRGFMNGGTVAEGISPGDLVVSLNLAENAIAIWGISLFD